MALYNKKEVNKQKFCAKYTKITQIINGRIFINTEMHDAISKRTKQEYILVAKLT